MILLSSPNAIGLRLIGGEPFQGLTREGGTLAGLPAVASDVVDDQIIVLDTCKLFVAYADQIDVSLSRHTALQMLDNPTNSSVTATPTNMVALWQVDSAAVRVEKHINWRTEQHTRDRSRRVGLPSPLHPADWMDTPTWDPRVPLRHS